MWVKLAIIAASLAATLAGGIGIGVKWVRGEWAQADLARERAETANALRRGETALRASQQFEVDRDAIRARLRASDARLAAALAAVDCAVPADALRGVRRAAGQLEPDADAGKP